MMAKKKKKTEESKACEDNSIVPQSCPCAVTIAKTDILISISLH